MLPQVLSRVLLLGFSYFTLKIKFICPKLSFIVAILVYVLALDAAAIERGRGIGDEGRHRPGHRALATLCMVETSPGVDIFPE